MEIAKGITSENYNSLDLSDYDNSDWATAFDYLEKRLTDRYIEPIHVLQTSEKNKLASEKRFGFTILAIDCLLIETLQSFFEGVTDSSGQSKQLFINFLTKRDNFKPYFKTEREAEDFYINFRCGILHQAQTFGDTKIWTIGQLIMHQGKYLVVNRDAFHRAVLNEKENYLNMLNKKNDETLLDNFKKKMDFIATS